MLHITMTGMYAGRVLCGAPRDTLGDTFEHLAYNEGSYQHQLAEMCPKCKRELLYDEEPNQ